MTRSVLIQASFLFIITGIPIQIVQFFFHFNLFIVTVLETEYIFHDASNTKTKIRLIFVKIIQNLEILLRP